MSRVRISSAALWLGLVLTIGCGPSAGERRLIGTWRIDPAEELREQMFETGLPGGESLEEASNRIKSPLEVTFHKKGRLSTTTRILGAPRTKEGTWELLESETHTVRVRCRLENQEPVETLIEFESEDAIRMVPPNIAVLDQEFVFRRVE